jgi:DNA excision repair protein ERCC-2
LKKSLKIAVRDIVAHGSRKGDLSFEFLSSTRPVDAIRIHQKIQQSRPENYTAEVAVSHQIETELFILTVGGRIDGVYHQADGVLIEEIKTTTRSLEYYRNNMDPLHWGQVKCYAYIYAREQSLNEIGTQLTYYQVDTGEIRKFEQRFTTNELESFFQDLVTGYLQWARTIVNWEKLRDASIHKLKFPFRNYRLGQREMAVGVYRTVKNGGQLMVQAATGIGKTMAVIFPTVKAIAEGLNAKIFYLTARTTGRIAAEKALDELRKKKLKVKSLTITAKDKICFKIENACNPEECEFARGYFDRVNDALSDIFHQDAFTRPAIEAIARFHQVCPFEFSLELSYWADCIICDYNYAFDPRVFLRRFFQDKSNDYTFLIDEAHNLVDRSREMFSAEIYKQQMLDVRRAIRNELPQIYKILGKINSWLVKERKKCEEHGQERYAKQPPDDLYPMLSGFLGSTERWLSLNIKAPFRDELLDLFFTVSGFMRVAEQYDENYATCYEKLEDDLKLKLFCIDPSIQLKNALKRCRAAIFFSATMAPMAYFKKILGCNENAAGFSIPSPFPAENLNLFISDRISTYYRDREKTRMQVSHAISTLINQKKGNYLVFFPSYEYLKIVSQSIKPYCPDSEILLQTPGMSESDRDEFLNRYRHTSPISIVGFAVMGGIFGEAIDLVGECLSGAIVVGVGLPGISLEKELIKDYFTHTHNAGFEYAYQYPGINRVFQAAGRVIRTEKDRGVVLLIDQRYASHRYRSLFPAEWKPIRVQNQDQFTKKIQAFWHQGSNP